MLISYEAAKFVGPKGWGKDDMRRANFIDNGLIQIFITHTTHGAPHSMVWNELRFTPRTGDQLSYSMLTHYVRGHLF